MTTTVRVWYEAHGIETGLHALLDWIEPWTPK